MAKNDFFSDNYVYKLLKQVSNFTGTTQEQKL